ncbi:helix-turn-helix transcriptional regulator [Marivita sp.]|uniref:helix-turn-helix transcriptional regulator n=1 Tax=Marivita sp. TaxID=2003365 RepID=UPI003F6EE8FD
MKKKLFQLYASGAAVCANTCVEPFEVSDLLESDKSFDEMCSVLPVATDRLLRDIEAAAIIGVSKATWWRRVADGTMPQPIRIGSITRWKLSEIAAAIERLAKERPDAPEPDTIAGPSKSEGQSKLDKVDLLKKETKQ